MTCNRYPSYMDFASNQPAHDDYFIHSNSMRIRYIDDMRRIQNHVRIKFFGCNSLYITDGDTSILVDPFFTRPEVNMSSSGRSQRIEPDGQIISAILRHLGINRVDAILVTHTHWDHALDIAQTWQVLTSQGQVNLFKIYGSESAMHIGMGGRVPHESIEVVGEHSHSIYSIRRSATSRGFKVCFLRGAHIPFLRRVQRDLGGRIIQDLDTPAMVKDYKQGAMFALLIEHEYGLILNQGSVNFIEDYYPRLISNHIQASTVEKIFDVLILGIAGFNHIGSLPGGIEIRNNFYNQVVQCTKPKTVLFSHWDNFYEDPCGLDNPVRWFMNAYDSRGYFIDSRNRQSGFVARRGGNTIRLNTQFYFIPFWEEIPILPTPGPRSPFTLPDANTLI